MILKWRVNTSLFLSTLLLSSSAVFATTSPAPNPAELSKDTVAAPMFRPFNADYLVYRGGKSHGTAKRYLHQKDQQYEMGYSSDITWLVFSDKRIGYECFCISE